MFQLTPSLRTGVECLDSVHRDLIATINRLQEAEENEAFPRALAILAEFRKELSAHFKSRDDYSDSVDFPKRDSDAKHHTESLVVLERLGRDISAGDVALGEASSECFNELLQSILLVDMPLLNWLADRANRLPLAGRITASHHLSS
jgi:hemerythrin